MLNKGYFFNKSTIPSFSMLEKTPLADKLSHVRVKTAIYHVCAMIKPKRNNSG